MSNPQIAGPVRCHVAYNLLVNRPSVVLHSTKRDVVDDFHKKKHFFLQAVPYSRDYKLKYEYLKSQLRKPVSSTCSQFNYRVRSCTYVKILIFFIYMQTSCL